MNHMTRSGITLDAATLRKSDTYSILEDICRDIELTDTQFEQAEQSYRAVAKWISESPDPVLRRANLYAHGSTALGTTVRPWTREDFDVDLICLVPHFHRSLGPAALKLIIGNRLKEHAVYSKMLEEKKRCWRLNHAREFHLDISPTIPNPGCGNGGELVPDKQVRDWKPTNPKGYKKWFEERASLVPSIKAVALDELAKARASVERFPERQRTRGILRRTIQLLKRHRDIYFADIAEDIAPISIVITTLAANAYKFCVERWQFDTELDLVCETIRMVPHFIEKHVVNGATFYVVPNETTVGENFAERWNKEPQRVHAFNLWHKKACADFDELRQLVGMDRLTESLGKALGSRTVQRVMDARTGSVSDARATGKLFYAPAVGLTQMPSAQATPVRTNRFHGD